MFDMKGREGVDIAIARVFVSCDIPFNVSCSQYFEQMVHAINDGLAWFKELSYGNLRTMLVDKEKVCLEKVVSPLKAS